MGCLKEHDWIAGGAVCKHHLLFCSAAQYGENETLWHRPCPRSSETLDQLRAPKVRMKLTYEEPWEVSRSSVPRCGSFHRGELHPRQAQPETCWPCGNLLTVHEKVSKSAGAGVMKGQGGADGLGEDIGRLQT